jgi:hypothetical protein
MNPITIKSTLIGEVQLLQDDLVKSTLTVDECLELLAAIIPWNKRKFGKQTLHLCGRRLTVCYHRAEHIISISTPSNHLMLRSGQHPQFCADLLKMCATLLPRAL